MVIVEPKLTNMSFTLVVSIDLGHIKPKWSGQNWKGGNSVEPWGLFYTKPPKIEDTSLYQVV